jgi:hypothetical protein
VDAFVETTAMIDLIFKEKATSDNVRAILQEYETTYSSQYVRMEIKRGFLQNLVTLYNKSVECVTLGEVFTYIGTISSTPRRNMLGTMLGTVAQFYEQIALRAVKEGAPAKDLTKTQKRLLESYLRTQIKKFWTGFSKEVDIILDTAECYKNKYSIKPPIMTVEGKFDNTLENCDKYKSGICRVRELFNENETAVKALIVALGEISTPDLETQKRLRALKDVMRVKKREVLRKECWRSGDAVIALEAPIDCEIVTHNCKHFMPICTALGQPLRCY